MFGNPHKKALKRACKEAELTLQYAAKVRRYRWDVLEAADLQALDAAISALQEALAAARGKHTQSAPQSAPDAANTAAHINGLAERLRTLLGAHGGSVYPVGWVNENIEMVLVAVLVAVGIRTFFFQPFKIPTNSMWPTYHGKVPYVQSLEAPEPSRLAKALQFVQHGARHYGVSAPGQLQGEAELLIEMRPVYSAGNNPQPVGFSLKPEAVHGRMLGILPTAHFAYLLKLGNQHVQFAVPPSVDARELLLKETAGINIESETQREALAQRIHQGPRGRWWLHTGKHYAAGQPILKVAVHTGDMLFVSRLRYHFFRPSVGHAFVFRTGSIPAMLGEDKYFIKRLVGAPGDALEVQAGTLLRNGEVSGQGYAALVKPVSLEGLTAEGKLAGSAPVLTPTGEVTPAVPPAHVFAMGDNSYHSADSRYFGPVPAQATIGPAVFVFYPFTNRWGPAK